MQQTETACDFKGAIRVELGIQHESAQSREAARRYCAAPAEQCAERILRERNEIRLIQSKIDTV